MQEQEKEGAGMDSMDGEVVQGMVWHGKNLSGIGEIYQNNDLHCHQ